MTHDFEAAYKMSDREILLYALRMWRNHIQTGDVNMSLRDAVNTGMKDKVKMLNSAQQEFVIRLEELAEYLLSSKYLLNNKPVGV